jgi:hypothetical protein
MTEKELPIHFANFLMSDKGYPKSSLLFDMVIQSQSDDGNNRTFIVDLTLIDTDYSKYLAIIEFRTEKPRGNLGAAMKLSIFNKALNIKDLLSYVVYATNDENIFGVSQFTRKGFIDMPKESFPEYISLQAKSQADDKVKIENWETITLKDKKEKIKGLRNAIFTSLISLLAGFFTVFYSNLTDKSNANKDFKFSAENDSAISDIARKIQKLQGNSVIRIDTVSTPQANQAISDLNKRLASFEASVTNAPDKLLKLQEINFEFKQLQTEIANEKEKNEMKVANLKERVDSLSNWSYNDCGYSFRICFRCDS